MTTDPPTYRLSLIPDACRALKALGRDAGWTADETTTPTTVTIWLDGERFGTWPIHWPPKPTETRTRAAWVASLLIDLVARLALDPDTDVSRTTERLTHDEAIDALNAAVMALALRIGAP